MGLDIMEKVFKKYSKTWICGDCEEKYFSQKLAEKCKCKKVSL